MRAIPPTKLTVTQLEEQFHLAQALTHHLNPGLAHELNAHRKLCLEELRKGQIHGGTKYNVMSKDTPYRRVSWNEIELTPDITLTMSDELVGKVLPVKLTKTLKRLIKTQVRLLQGVR